MEIHDQMLGFRSQNYFYYFSFAVTIFEEVSLGFKTLFSLKQAGTLAAKRADNFTLILLNRENGTLTVNVIALCNIKFLFSASPSPGVDIVRKTGGDE